MVIKENHGRMPSPEQLAWLRLKLTPGLGNRVALRLIERFGSPEAVFAADRESLAAIPGIRHDAVAALVDRRVEREPLDEWDDLLRLGAFMVWPGHSRYPENLKTIADRPTLLFVKGTLEPRDLVAVAIVGSRFASPMGLGFTERLAADLALAGVTIVSGLAIGIDAAAHRGALKGGGRTLAVLGCGLDVSYPRPNLGLKNEISGRGAVMTELPLNTAPLPGHFPMRNRIISGLSLGVVVVEAAERSGSLITARLALEQGREVFAVPGIARRRQSIGPHRLLRQGAKLVENAEDVLEEIRPLIRSELLAAGGNREGPPPPNLDADERRLFETLGTTPMHLDRLCRELQWPVSRVSALLSVLELKGLVVQHRGKSFTKRL